MSVLPRPATRPRVAAAAGVVTVLAVSLLSTPEARASVPPLKEAGSTIATADALPTAQIDGVAWAQAISGDTVFVGGDFTTARPAGAAAGQQTVPRGNLMAYSLSTGQLRDFAPKANEQVTALAVSPDGTRLYVGGQFTTIAQTSGGTTSTYNRYRVAAFDTATGRLVSSWAPTVNYVVKSIVATDKTVFLGGQFATVNGAKRNRAAAVKASDGTVLPWNPNVDNQVSAMVLTPDKSEVILGGSFKTVGGAAAYGLAAVSTASGALEPWQANQLVRNAGANAGITSLSTDGTAIYGSGYVYGAGGNLEGAFSADPKTGAINWIEDCHGDTYGVWASATAVYTVGHAHYCGNIGGFPDKSGSWQRAVAFTHAATGTVAHDPTNGSYHDWFGQPAPSLASWYPQLTPGSYTGDTQAAWTVTGTSKYVVLGGEFPSVNGRAQQGLVRFAVPSAAPNQVGPQVAAGNFTPALASPSKGVVTVSWTSNWDRDDLALTYTVYRDGTSGGPIATVSGKSTFWKQPVLSITDKKLASGSTHGYRVFATDADGNVVRGNTAEITVS